MGSFGGPRDQPGLLQHVVIRRKAGPGRGQSQAFSSPPFPTPESVPCLTSVSPADPPLRRFALTTLSRTCLPQYGDRPRPRDHPLPPSNRASKFRGKCRVHGPASAARMERRSINFNFHGRRQESAAMMSPKNPSAPRGEWRRKQPQDLHRLPGRTATNPSRHELATTPSVPSEPTKTVPGQIVTGSVERRRAQLPPNSPVAAPLPSRQHVGLVVKNTILEASGLSPSFSFSRYICRRGATRTGTRDRRNKSEPLPASPRPGVTWH